MEFGSRRSVRIACDALVRPHGGFLEGRYRQPAVSPFRDDRLDQVSRPLEVGSQDRQRVDLLVGWLEILKRSWVHHDITIHS